MALLNTKMKWNETIGASIDHRNYQQVSLTTDSDTMIDIYGLCLITIPSGFFLNIKILNFIFLFFSSSYRQIVLPFYPALQIHFVNTHLNLSKNTVLSE